MQTVILGDDVYVGRTIVQQGWCWSKDVKPIVGTPSCQTHHQGVVLSGYLKITTDEGIQRIIGPGEAFDVQPGHDGCVIGDEPCVSIEFHGVRDWARPVLDTRVLKTLLFTDMVGSTALAARLGDTAWKALLEKHYRRVRLELERYRGEESKITGDGFLALFDGTERAVRCASCDLPGC